jgi:hypothetical protein
MNVTSVKLLRKNGHPVSTIAGMMAFASKVLDAITPVD